MQEFLGFAIPAIPYGCTYAVVAVALVLTYQATGVFNFAFAAQAYVSSLVFTALVTSAHAPVWLAFVLAVVVLLAMVGMMRFTGLGLQMRGAVESRRLVQLDGVNAGGVVAVAWAVSSFLAGLAGVMLAPNFNGELMAEPFVTLMVAAIAAAAVAAFRSMPIAAIAAVVIGIATFTLQGYLPPESIFYKSFIPSLPFIVLVGALLFVPGMRSLDRASDPLASVDPPLPPTAAASRTPSMDRVIKVGWYVLLGAFIVSMLTWMPNAWENVFNEGLALSTIFLSITLITGMGGQLSLAQGALAGIGGFTAAQLANHLGFSLLVGGIIGAVFAAVAATLLAVLSLRLRGLGLALMTLAAALVFDQVLSQEQSIGGGASGVEPATAAQRATWGRPFNVIGTNGHSYFVVSLLVLVVVTVAILLLRRGTLGRLLGAMRGSETGAAGIGINLTWQRILIFALSGVVAGIGGTMFVLQQTQANPQSFNYELSLAFVVIVVTTGVGSVEGAMQGAFGYVIINKLLGFLPVRYQGLTFVLFAFGALTYAAHPEGILEYQKRRWMQRMEPLTNRVFSGSGSDRGAGPGPDPGSGNGAPPGPPRQPLAPAGVANEVRSA